MSDDRPQKKLGTKIRDLRKAKGLSIGAVAHAAELDVTYMGQIERGTRDPSVSTLHKIAKGLGVSIVDLFRDEKPVIAGVDERIAAQVRAAVHGRTEEQKEKILTILKRLHDTERLNALARLLRK